MNRIRFRVVAFVCVVSLTLPAALPVWGATDAPIAGEHIVQKGETLYCIGRGYGVVPSAIASANELSTNARLSLGQVLRIPAVQWTPIPRGPVCAPQFTPSFPSLYAGTPVSVAGATTPPTPTPGPARTYGVRAGDTLSRISRRFGVTVAAIMATNGITNPNLIYVGQVLVIPDGGTTVTPPPPTDNCDPSYPDVCLRVGIGDYDCADGLGDGPYYVSGPVRVLPPDAFGLDADGDGIGCER